MADPNIRYKGGGGFNKLKEFTRIHYTLCKCTCDKYIKCFQAIIYENGQDKWGIYSYSIKFDVGFNEIILIIM